MELQTILQFGKYKGQLLTEVNKKDPGYIQWCIENIGDFEEKYELEFLNDNLTGNPLMMFSSLAEGERYMKQFEKDSKANNISDK